MKTRQLKVGDFDVAVSFYTDNVLIIIHNSIPGVGSIICTEREGQGIDCDQLLGPQMEMSTLFATKLAEQFSVPSATIVLAFHPSKMQTFEDIRNFMDQFNKAGQEQA